MGKRQVVITCALALLAGMVSIWLGWTFTPPSTPASAPLNSTAMPFVAGTPEPHSSNDSRLDHSSGPHSSELQSESRDESDSVRQLREHGDWVRAIVDELLRRGDAESLAVAASVMESMSGYFTATTEKRSQFRRRTLDLYRRAAASAPTDPVLQWLALSACRMAATYNIDCDTAEYDRALRTHDPKNLTAWFGELDSAIRAGDDAQRAEVIANMARGARFDTYEVAITALKHKVLESIRLPPPTALLREARHPIQSLAQATAMRGGPPMRALFQACAASVGTLRENCHEIVRTMRNDGSVGAALSGLILAQEMSVGYANESQVIAQERQRLEWQRAQLLRLTREHGGAVALLQAGQNIAGTQAVLRDNGIPLDPPPDWTRP